MLSTLRLFYFFDCPVDVDDWHLWLVQGKLDPVVGRLPQIERVTQILGRRTKNNPCLIGEPGVGKTAIAEGLAQRIASGDVPETLEGKKVITLDMGLLVAGTKYRGEFEERLKKLMEEIKQADDIILMIDEVHTLIGAGAAEGAIDAANILKPALARGELQVLTLRFYAFLMAKMVLISFCTTVSFILKGTFCKEHLVLVFVIF